MVGMIFAQIAPVVDGICVGNSMGEEALAAIDTVDPIINCAASVKHFADLDFLKETNVYGVGNLIELCLEKKIRLVQISTVSVCGERNTGRGRFWRQ